MDNNINLIYRRLSQLRSLIPQFRTHSSSAEIRLANEIITLEPKRIEAIHVIEKKLGELRGLIPVYKARGPSYKQMLADQIINLDLQLIAAKSNQHLPEQPSKHTPAPQIPAPEQIQSNDMAEIFTERPRQIPNLYWQQGQPVGAPVRTFRQIKYLPLPNAMPDPDQALNGARLDCGWDLHKQLIEYG